MAVTGQDEQPATAGPEGLAGLEAVAEISCPTGRVARLGAALEVIEAEDAARAAEAADQAAAAAAEAEHRRKLGGRKPKDPVAALARAEIDHAAASERVNTMQAARAAKLAAAARGEQVKGPPPCRIERAKRALERAEVALAAALEAVKNAHPARRANITDPDSRIMKTQKGWVQGYNAQAIVNQHQIVLACEVSQHTSDVELFRPMTDTLAQTLAGAGINADVELMLADAGYCSEANLTSPGPDRLIATTKITSSAVPPASWDKPPVQHPPTRLPSRRWNTCYAPPKAPAPTPNAPA